MRWLTMVNAVSLPLALSARICFGQLRLAAVRRSCSMPPAAGAPAPRQEELLFTQTALLSRTTHISRRYAIKHADPKCHKQVLQLTLTLPTKLLRSRAYVHLVLGLQACVKLSWTVAAAATSCVQAAWSQCVRTSAASQQAPLILTLGLQLIPWAVASQLSSALSAHITSLLVRLVANARHRNEGGGRRAADLEYETDVRVAIGAIQRKAKQEADRCATARKPV